MEFFGINIKNRAPTGQKKKNRTNRYGELMLKIPFFKSTEDKIEQAFDKHPERKKVCFHFTESIRDGVFFYDPTGLEVFTIRSNKKNLKGFDLYEYGRFVGRIEKKVILTRHIFMQIQNVPIRCLLQKMIIKDFPKI